MSLNFGHIGPPSRELAALDRKKMSHRLIMGIGCLHASLFMFETSSKMVVATTSITILRSMTLYLLDPKTLKQMALLFENYLKYLITLFVGFQVSDRCPLGYLFLKQLRNF